MTFANITWPEFLRAQRVKSSRPKAGPKGCQLVYYAWYSILILYEAVLSASTPKQFHKAWAPVHLRNYEFRKKGIFSNIPFFTLVDENSVTDAAFIN